MPLAASAVTERYRFLGRYPRTLICATVVVLFAALAELLRTENQFEVVVLLAFLVGAVSAADNTVAGRAWIASFRNHPALVNLLAFIASLALIFVFRREHYVLLMMGTVAFFAIACIGINLQLAFAGVINFAGAAFFVAGSYTAAVLASQTALPHILILAVCGAMAGLLGLCILIPVLRTRGHYAALVTIAFGLLVRTFLEVNDVLGGPQGMKIPGLEILGFNFSNVTKIAGMRVSFYLWYVLFALLLLTAAMVLVRLLEKSWIGIALDAVRSDEIAASVFGLNIAYWKAFAFFFGNVLIGIAGGAYGTMNGFVTPIGAGLGDSLLMLSIVVLGGLGNMWGTIGAALIVLLLPEKLQAIQEYRLLIFAVLVMLILRYRPEGILPRSLRTFSVRERKGAIHG